MLKRVNENRHPCQTQTIVQNKPPTLLLKRTVLVALSLRFLMMDEIGTDVVPLHGCPQSCMPNPVKDFLEVYEEMVEILLVLEIFLTKDSRVEDLLCGAPFCSEACLFFSNDLLHLQLQSVQYDFAWTADGSDLSILLALLQVAFLG